MIINKFKNKLIAREEDQLGHKVVKSSFWVVFIKVFQKLLGLIRNIVVARMLSPDDLGIFGIALLTFSALEHLANTGFGQALIQKKERSEEYLDTAWTVQIIRGIVLTLALILIAPLVGGFFKEPDAVRIIQVLSVTMLTGGLANIGVIYFRKNLTFHKEFIWRLTGSSFDLIATIVALVIFQNIWALVIGAIVGSVVNLIVSYSIHSFRPKIKFNYQQAKELFGFGKWIFGSGVLTYLITEGDDIVLGRMLGAGSLGLYQMAYRISNFPATQITNLLSNICFPAYSQIQDDLKRIGRAYLKIFKAITFLAFPVSLLIFLLANDFTLIVLGEKWLPAVPAIRGLIIWGLIRSIGGTSGPVFQARGRPDIATKLQVFKLIVLAIIIYPLTKTYGMMGTVWAVVISAGIANPITDYYVIKFIQIGAWDFIKRIFYPLVGVGISGLIYYLLRSQILVEASLINLFIWGAIISIIYLGFMLALNKLRIYTFDLKQIFSRLN